MGSVESASGYDQLSGLVIFDCVKTHDFHGGLLYTVSLVPGFLRLPGVSKILSQISTDVVSLFAGHFILIWAVRQFIRWR
jgi:hypothetical protein